MYNSLEIHVDIGTNARYIELEGQNDNLDGKKNPLFSILRVKINFCTTNNAGGPVPNLPIQYSHKYWAVPYTLFIRNPARTQV